MTQKDKEVCGDCRYDCIGRVVGQEDAVKAIARAVRRSRPAFDPASSRRYLSCPRPTGVGKTELAKALAQHVAVR